MYIDSIGYAHVVGEVQWNGSYNIDFVELTATFRNTSGQVVAVGFTFTSISILIPKERSPFEILEGNNIPWIQSYTLQVTDFRRTTHVPYRAFLTTGDSMYTDSISYVHVVGTATNTGQATAKSVETVVTFRDASGRAVATAFSFTSPNDLSAGATGSFDVIHHKNDAWASIVSYEIQVAIAFE
jgi:hypothetical protein